MPAASRYLLLLCAGLCFAVTFGAFLVYERPGLGLGHFYYLGIALAAMALVHGSGSSQDWWRRVSMPAACC